MPAGDPPLTLGDFAALPLDKIKGVGPKKAESAAALGITSVLDLLTYYPRRYLDRTREATVDELQEGDEGMVLVEVESVSARRTRNKKSMVEVRVGDATGRLKIVFFNQPWRERQLVPGRVAVIYGKLEVFRQVRQMTNPIVDLIGDRTGRIVPVYPQSEKAGIATFDLAAWTEDALVKAAPRGIADPVPASVRDRHRFVDRQQALHDIHHPAAMPDAVGARRRLVFDELLRVQLRLVQRKRELERTTTGVAHRVGGVLTARFREKLAFPLTGAQERVIAEIETDLAARHPMHRLLQGDVGAGKTVVAVSAMLVAVDGGHQGALMAPTEVLAEQHHASVSALLADFTVPDPETLMGERELRVALLVSRIGAAARRLVLADLEAGRIDIVIGTHALIQDAVAFRSLGVVVIDEQHRFGVEQRAALRAKNPDGSVPDVLVMTATPIPRTAAMTVYGDLDVSVLDELPPGRTPIVTRWSATDDDVSALWEHVRSDVAAGRQAYVVCPLIEESEKLEVAAAEETHARLVGDELSGLAVGLLHGRVSTADKEATMTAFRAGGLDVLVATTVIEVGVDVANATVMVILDADRFGIAQLHQLRGRVGRGAHRSYCYLVAQPTTADGEARIEAMVATTDGFELAEIDLDLRGEGTIMGERQKGRNELKLASLRRDREWVVAAREVAVELLDADPNLRRHRALADEVDLLLGEDEADFLLKN